MNPQDRPTYDLELIKHLVRTKQYRTTGAALEGAAELELDEDDVVACTLSLTSADFYKSMPSEKRPDLFQDVYRPLYFGTKMYVKLQIEDHPPTGRAVVISFKKK